MQAGLELIFGDELRGARRPSFVIDEPINGQELTVRMYADGGVDKRAVIAPKTQRLLAQAVMMEPLGTAAPREVVVSYLSPNLNKPLHLGHLRSIAVGHTLASMYRWAGHTVIEDIHASDIGVGISLARWACRDFTPELIRGADAAKFIGDRYSKHAKELSDEPAHDNGPELARMLYGAHFRGLPDVADWHADMTVAVLAHQKRDFERLGIGARWRFESDSVERASEIQRGLGGTQSWEYRITSGEGVSTGWDVAPDIKNPPPGQSARTEYVDFCADRSPRELHITVCGAEWTQAVNQYQAVYHKLPGYTRQRRENWRYVIHGMVKSEGQDVKSAKGDVPLLCDTLFKDEDSAAERRRLFHPYLNARLASDLELPTFSDPEDDPGIWPWSAPSEDVQPDSAARVLLLRREFDVALRDMDPGYFYDKLLNLNARCGRTKCPVLQLGVYEGLRALGLMSDDSWENWHGIMVKHLNHWLSMQDATQ